MKRTVLVLVFAVAACGGKSKPVESTEAPPSGGRMAAPGTVIGDAKLYETVKASTIALPAGQPDMLCEGDQTTLGAQVAAWEKTMGGAINASCEGKHCTVRLNSQIDPSCDTNPDQEGCEGSAQVIEFDLDDAGAIDVATLMCMAAG